MRKTLARLVQRTASLVPLRVTAHWSEQSAKKICKIQYEDLSFSDVPKLDLGSSLYLLQALFNVFVQTFHD